MEVKPVTYDGVKLGRYFISDTGKLYRLECGKITELRGCNPKNEKGYIRATLATADGKVKKFAVHRLVMNEFIGPSDLEVNHKDGIKTNNSIDNLEYVTGDENKHHAAVNNLYRSCEDVPNASLDNKTVHEICKCFENGYHIRKVIKTLNLPRTKNMECTLMRILFRQTWTRISDGYNWDYDDVRLKVYKYKDLLLFAKLILTNCYTSREIAKKFKKYDEKKTIQVIKKMRQRKLYRTIIEEAERSTTIDNASLTDSDGFRILVRKRR